MPRTRRVQPALGSFWRGRLQNRIVEVTPGPLGATVAGQVSLKYLTRENGGRFNRTLSITSFYRFYAPETMPSIGSRCWRLSNAAETIMVSRIDVGTDRAIRTITGKTSAGKTISIPFNLWMMEYTTQRDLCKSVAVASTVTVKKRGPRSAYDKLLDDDIV